MKLNKRKILSVVVSFATVVGTIIALVSCAPENSNKDSIETTTTTTVTTTTAVTLLTQSTTSIITSDSVVTGQTTQQLTNTTEESTTTTTTTVDIVVEEYVVYKPSTHYIHRNTCRWATNDAYRIENTEGIEVRKCSECNPIMDVITVYIEPTPQIGELTYVKHFTRGTYYAYGGHRKGGSQRQLIDCSIGNGIVKGSVASSYLYRTFGYNYNGKRTMIYLEIEGYPQMNGYYYLDDCSRQTDYYSGSKLIDSDSVIDFFFLYGSNCPFRNQGVVQVDCYIVN